MKKMLAFAVVLILGVVFLQFHTYEAASIISETGYAMPKNTIEETLLSEEESKEDTISLVSVEEQDIVYQNGSQYYVGEDEKTKIDFDYPLVIKDGYGLYFVQSGAYLVSEDFETLPVLEQMYVVDAHSFHSDGSEADLVKFLLVQLKNGLHMNVQSMEVTTQLEQYTIPFHSIVSFQEAQINAYVYQQGSYTYQSIHGLQGATIRIGGKTWTYREFLSKLNIVKEEVKELIEKEEETKEEIEELLEEEQNKPVLKQPSSKPNEKEEESSQPNPEVEEQTPSDDEVNGEVESKPEEDKPSTPEEDDEENKQPDENEPSQRPNNPDGEKPPHEGGDGETGGDQDGDLGGDEGEGGEDNPDDGGDDDGEIGGDGDEGEGDNAQPAYVEPSASFENLIPWTYTLHGDLTINDPSSRLIRNARLTVYDEKGTPVLRKQYKNTEKVVLSTLEPDRNFVIEGTFQFYNEEGKKEEKVFLQKQVFRTLPIEGNVSPIDFQYETENVLLPNAVRMNQMQLKNTTDYDAEDTSLENFYKNTLPYVSNAKLRYKTDEKTDGSEIETSFPSAIMKSLVQGESVDFKSSTLFESDKSYNYTIQFIDKFGNEIATKTVLQGSVATSKEVPQAKIAVKESKAGKFEFAVEIIDKDNALLTKEYRLRIVNEAGEPLSLEGTINGKEAFSSTELTSSGNNTFEITNLPFSQLLKMEIIADYDTNNGEGEKKDTLIGYSQFYSAPLSAGTITYDTSIYDINGTYANLDVGISTRSTSALVSLLTDLELELTSNKGETFVYPLSKEMFNEVGIDAYDKETNELVIQQANPATKQPYIGLAVDQSLVEDGTYSNWELWKNGASNVLGEQSGVLKIRLCENTLTPSTKYSIKIRSKANQGGYVYDLQSIVTRESFTTKKREPKVHMKDYFIGSDFIELFQVQTEDTDGTIINGKYSLQLKKGEQTIQSVDLKTNQEEDSIRFSQLSKGETYQIQFVAAEYNDGPTASTLISNHVFKEMSFVAGEGISSTMEIRDFSIDYSDKTIFNGRLDASKIQFGKTMNTSTLELIDNEHRFVSGLIPIDPSKQYFIKDAGATNITLLLYRSQEDKKPTAVTLHGNLSRFSKDNINNFSQYSYVQIIGWTGFEYLASIFEATGSEGKIDHSTLIPDTSFSGATITTSLGNALTEPMAVKSGELYYFDYGTKITAIQLLDENKEFIATRSVDNRPFEVAGGVHYIRIAIPSYKTNTDAQMYKVQGIGDYDAYKGAFSWTIEDKLGILKAGDTYELNVYQSKRADKEPTDLIRTTSYQFEAGENGFVKPIQELIQDELEPNCAYRYEISVNYNNNKVVLSQVSFTTQNNIHILRNSEDLYLLRWYPYDTFYAVNDIQEVKNGASFYAEYFHGVIDFQGHTLTLTNLGGKISNLGKTGVIRNMNVDGGVRTYFVTYNKGTIQNITVELSPYPYNTKPDRVGYPFVYQNNGTGVLENFAFEITENMQMEATLQGMIVFSNNGTIRNGYVYHSNPSGIVYANSGKGALVSNNDWNGKIENIYMISDIASPMENASEAKKDGLVAATNSGTIRNVIGVGDRKGYLTYGSDFVLGDYLNASDPLFGETTSTTSHRYQNVFLYSKYKGYNSNRVQYVGEKEMNSAVWYQDKLKGSNFLIEESVPYGFYPRVDMGEMMMKHQPYLELPEYKETKKPEYLSSEVVKSTNDYVDVKLHLKNESKAVISSVSVKDLTAVVIEQAEEKDGYYVVVRLSNPKTYVSQYTLETFSYESEGKTLTSDLIDQKIDAEFYYPIHTFSDWARMQSVPNENYRLMGDLDFSVLSDFNTAYISSFSGILDGGKYDNDGNLIGRYTLKNIDLVKRRALFETLNDGAQIKNLNVKSLKRSKTSTYWEFGLIYISRGAILDQIHIEDVEAETTYGASLVTVAENTVITNCSAVNVKLTDRKDASSLRLGGLVAAASGTSIRNCFTQNIDLSSEYSLISFGTLWYGGISGSLSNGIIENCYAQGKINGVKNVGGIVGSAVTNAFIKKCWSDVAIEASYDNVGGMSGTGIDGNITNSFVLGNILTTNGSFMNIHRIAGNVMHLNHQNFAYEKQLFNNDPNYGNDDATQLLSAEQLTKEDTFLTQIGLGSSYDYSVLNDGQMPLLKSTTGEILPNQEPVYFDKGQNQMKVLSAIRKDYDENLFETVILLEHPNYEYVGAKMEGMYIDESKTKIEKINENSTRVTLSTTKEKAVDAYKLTVLFQSKDGKRTQEVNGLVEFEGGPVYWQINSVAEWEKIVDAGHGTSFENFLIQNTLDFGNDMRFGDLKVNRLVGKTKDTTIQNLVYTFQETNNAMGFKNLIAEATAEISSLNFVDCSYTYSLSKPRSYLGFVGNNRGIMEQVHFEDCHVSIQYGGESRYEYMGMVGYQRGNVRNVSGTNISVENLHSIKPTATPDYYLGGIFGCNGGDLKDVHVEGSTVKASTTSHVGGISGYASKVNVDAEKNERIYGTDLHVEGRIYVGGLFGLNALSTYSMYADGGEIIGKQAVGGLVGVGSGQINNTLLNEELPDSKDITAQNLTVTGEHIVGGIKGQEASLIKVTATNLKVTATDSVGGGLVGRGVTINTATIDNSTITAKDAAGGAGGSGVSLSNVNVTNCSVTAEDRYAGGLVASSTFSGKVDDGTINFEASANTYMQYCGVFDTTVMANSYAGGLSGYQNSNYANTVAVKDTTVNAKEDYAGGFFGAAKTFSHIASYVANVNVQAKQYAGGVTGLFVKGGTTYSSRVGYIFANIKAEDYAGGIFGKVDDGCVTSGTLEKLIVYPTIESSGTHVNYIGTNYTRLKPTATNMKLLKIVDRSSISGNSIQQEQLQDAEVEKIIAYQDLSKSSTYSDMEIAMNWFRLDSVAANVEDLLVLPSGVQKGFTVGVLGSNYSGKGTLRIDYGSTKIFNSDIILTDGTAEILADGSDGSNGFWNGTFNNVKFTLTIGGQTWSRMFNSYIPQNKYFKGDSEQILTVGDTISLPEGHTYTWYRSVNPWYYTATAELKYSGYNATSLTVESRGYYFAVNEEGAFSPMYFVNGNGYMPYRKGSGVSPYQAGKDDKGNYYSTSDFFYHGGYVIEPYAPSQPCNSDANEGVLDFDVYASGVDSINIELKEEMYANYRVQVKTAEDTQEYEMNGRTLTLGYDFVQPMSITVENGLQTLTKEIQPEDLRQTISMYQNHYYYLVENGIANEDKVYEQKGIHLYEQYALLEDGTIFDLLEESTQSAMCLGEQLDTKPLAVQELNGQRIETYQNYSKINTGTSRDLRMYVKDARLFAIDSSIPMQINGVLVDHYQDKNIQTQLSEDGTLINYMDSIQVPKGFKNRNIKEMTHSLNSDSHIVLVRYEDGDLVAFNYLNGEEIEVESMKETPSFMSFIKEQITALFSSDANEMDSRYQTSLQLQKELQMLSEEEKELLEHYAEDETNTQLPSSSTSITHMTNPYTTVYEQESDSYQTYAVNDLLMNEQKEVMSENDKLQALKDKGENLNIQEDLVASNKDTTENKTAEIGFVLLSIAIAGCLWIMLKKRKQWFSQTN